MTAPSPDPRPLLALVNNVQTPYRVHLHRRIVREIPSLRIASLYTHDQADQPWENQRVDEINPVLFGRGHPVSQQSHPRWALADWNKGGRIIAWLKEQRAAAVILGGYNDLTRMRLIRWCRRAGIPCFVFADSNIHDDRVNGLKKVLKRAIVGWVVRNVKGLMPCGSAGTKFFERYGATADRCFFVPYEPDYDLIRSLPESDVQRARVDFGLSPERKRLVVCSRLIDRKRIDLAIDGFAALAKEFPTWDLVIIGSGPMRESLAARVPRELHDRVIWTGFLGDQSRISGIYRASHVLVCPSDLEPWGVVVNEAAAAGLAIVSSAVVGAAAELVEDGVNGYLFEAGNLDSIRERLRLVMSPSATESLRAGSAQVLARWRERGDPVQGIRKALAWANVRT